MQTANDPPLFTPGPLTTSRTVKQAMLRDLGSRSREFLEVVRDVRRGVLEVAKADPAQWTCVPMQGSGTFGIESAITTAVPRGGRLLVVANGAYGRRMGMIAAKQGIAVDTLEFPETQQVDPEAVRRALRDQPERPALLACVHCETTTGLVNPIEAVARVGAEAGIPVMIDSMSGLGALPVDCGAMPGLTWLVSSANKCIEGVPGLALTVVRTSALAACEGNARSLSLDAHEQWKGLEKDGQFRFTPPTHVLLALSQALSELRAEGGPPARLARYSSIQAIVVRGLRELGYRTLLPDALLSPIITSFLYPDRPDFKFEQFAAALVDLGYVIYPGKVSTAPCFRVGSVGRLTPADAHGLVRAIESLAKS